MTRRQPPLVYCFLVLLFLSTISRADEFNTPGALPEDESGNWFELGRHEQLIATMNNPDSMLNDFTTDGCSGGLSAGWEYLVKGRERLHTIHGSKPPWELCCIEHDRVYHAAGLKHNTSAADSFNARKSADQVLRQCVLETGLKRTSELSAAYSLSTREIELLYSAIANLMYRAVRIGGVPCSGLPWRWGYGWPTCE